MPSSSEKLLIGRASIDIPGQTCYHSTMKNPKYLAVGVNFEQGYTNSMGTDASSKKAVLSELSAYFKCHKDCWDEVLLINRTLNVVKVWRQK